MITDEGSVPYSSCESSNNIQEGGVELTPLVCDVEK